MNRELATIARRTGAVMLIIIVLGLGACSDDDSPTSPPSVPDWSSDGIVLTGPYGTDPAYPSSLVYKTVDDVVYLQGSANAGSTHVQSGQVIGTLPEGQRPPAGTSILLLCPTWGWPTGHGLSGFVGTAGVTIFDDGTITVKTVQHFDGEQQFVMFDGLSFSTVNDGGGGWSNAGITWTAPYTTGEGFSSSLEYRKVGTMVYLQGFANAGGTHVQTDQVIGTLPEGYRPAAGTSAILLCPSWGWPAGHANGYIGTAGVSIFADGTITIRTLQQFDGEMQFLNFDGLCFSTVADSDGWTNNGLTWTAPYSDGGGFPSSLTYRLSGDLAQLNGFANAGGDHVQAGGVVGTLPEGYRPAAPESAFLLCPTWGWPAAVSSGYIGTAGVIVETDGTINVRTVQQYDGEQQFLNFDGKCINTAF